MSTTFNYTGSVQTYTVPNTTSILVDAYGASGKSGQVHGEGVQTYTFWAGPGRGGRVQTVIQVTPGQVLYIYVGGINGYNGGGKILRYGYDYRNGGGATDIRIGGTALTNRILVAGGGGGPGYTPWRGGAGGGLVGENGLMDGFQSGTGGSQIAGGDSGVSSIIALKGQDGGLGFGGNVDPSGNPSDKFDWGGGGGGGYYGGGAGSGRYNYHVGAGGGGSSYAHPTSAAPIKGTFNNNDADWPLFVNQSEAKAVSSTDSATQSTTKYQGYYLWKPNGYNGDFAQGYNGAFAQSYFTVHTQAQRTGNGILTILPISQPVLIDLIGTNPIIVGKGYLNKDYLGGVKATSDTYGDLTADIVVTDTVNTSTISTYLLTFNVTDVDGLSAKPFYRTVRVVLSKDYRVGVGPIDLQWGLGWGTPLSLLNVDFSPYLNYLATLTMDHIGPEEIDTTEVFVGLDLTDQAGNGPNFTGCNVAGMNFSGSNLSGGNLTNANLSNTNFSNCNLTGADLSNADLSNANFSNCTLIGANLSGANLSGANLSGANFFNSILGSNLNAAEVTTVQTPPPVITLNGDILVVHKKGTPYTDPGATTSEGTITTTGTVDENTTTGIYKITYSATDLANNTGTKERIIVVSDADWSQVDLFDWSQVAGDIDGASAGDQSGHSVSLSSDGSTVAIGAPYNDSNGSNSGHVRVYKYDGSSWGQLGDDIKGEALYDQSGWSVSLSSDGFTVAIGAIVSAGNGAQSGHVRVYQYDGNSWGQLGADIDGDAAGDWSGFSVSLSSDGSTVAIGAPFNDNNGNTYSGHVRVYKYNGNSWGPLGSDIDGAAAGDQSGRSVSLSSDGYTVAIGVPYKGGGHVRVYKFINDSWAKVGLDIDGAAANDNSGYSVSLSSDGTTVAIGAPYNDGTNGTADSGHVRVYKYDGTSWGQLGADIDGETAGDQSGLSVSLNSDGNIVAIGAPYNDDINGADSGHVRVYKYNGVSWTKVGGDIDGAAANDRSGYSVSLSSDGSTVAIGAPYNDGINGADSGHVRVYKYNDVSWEKVGGDIDGAAASDLSGASVSLSSDGFTVAIGAVHTGGKGHVRVYELKSAVAIAVNGYYPLYKREVQANSVSSSNSSQSYELNGTTYYMPNGLQPEDKYLGEVDRVARREKMTTALEVSNGRASKDAAATVNARNALKEEILSAGTEVQKKSKRRKSLKLMFDKNSELKQIPMMRDDLGISDQKLKRENVVVVRAGATIDVSDVNSKNESFYCPLANDGDQIILAKGVGGFKVKRQDAGVVEKFAILNAENVASITRTRDGTTEQYLSLNTYDLVEDDLLSVTFSDGNAIDFFIGSIGDASGTASSGASGDPFLVTLL